MHNDAALVEERLERVMRTVRPHVWEEIAPVEVSAWQVPGEPVDFAAAREAVYSPLANGTWWGRAWATMWLHITGEVPERARGSRIELEVDLGFSGDWAGNQCEGMVYTADGRPLKAVNPMHQTVVLPEEMTHVDVFVEAAANPNLSHKIGHYTPLGDPDTIPDELLYRFAGARLVRRRDEVWGLLLDLEVAHGLMRQLPERSTRRARLLRSLEQAADELDSQRVVSTAAAAREALRPAMEARANASAQKMLAVGHAHIDSAWLWPIRETRRKTVRTFSNVLALASEYPDFHFACTTPQQYAWVREAAPDVFIGIKEAIARGQWHPVGGMWVESDANLPGGEALVRQFTTGLRWFESNLGVSTDCLWLPDSFGYSGALPQIAKLAGMRWFFTQKMSWNRTNTMPHHTFWWEGIDGTRLWTHFPPVNCYDSVVSPEEVKKAEANFAEKGRADWSLLPYGYGDGGGGPTREMVERVHRFADLEDAPRLVNGGPDEFFELARAEYTDLPVWQGELYLEFHRGCYTSQAAMKRGNRRSEHLLAEVEVLASLSAAPYPHDELEHLWRQVLLLQFHDILPGSSIAWVHREARADYAQIADRLTVLRGRALAGLPGQPAPVIANGSPVDRREVIDSADGGPQLVQVPAHSVHPVRLASVAPRNVVQGIELADGIVLDNGLVRAQFDHDGLVVSLIDLRPVSEQEESREIILDGRRAGLLQLHPDLPCSFDAWELEEHYRHRATDLVEADSVRLVADGPLRASVEVVRRFGESTLKQVTSLDADSLALDVELHVDWREREKILKVSYPLAVHAREMLSECQFGHISRPVHTNTSWDAARFETWAHRWVHVSDGRHGVALANEATYGHDVTAAVSVSGERGVDLRLSLLRGPGSPDPTCDLGQHTLRWSLVVGADLRAARQAGYRLNMPLRAAIAAAASCPVRSTHPDVVIDTVKRAFEGDDLVVRLHEAAGSRTRATLEVCGAWMVTEVDLLERDVEQPTQRLGSGPVVFDEVSLDLHPFQILTLRLRPVDA